MALGVIDQPVALASEITIQRLEGGPQLSRGRDRLSATWLALEMMHDRSNTIDADPGTFGLAIPNAPVQSLDLRDDRSLRRHLCRIIGPQEAGDLLQVLEPHADIKPVENRQFGDAGIGENASKAQGTHR